MLKSDVFERNGTDTMSRNAFFLVIGATLAWGFAVAGFAAQYTATWVPANQTELWIAFGAVFGLALLGILMSGLSSNPFVSFIGFNLVAAPFGAMLGPIVHMYATEMPGVVTQAAYLTGGITVVMAASGLMFPKFYASIGGALFGALIAIAVVAVAALFIPGLHEMTWIHYLAAGVFALYIGYDMHRASQIPATADNAIDVAVALYLDIINLFLRILIILGRRR